MDNLSLIQNCLRRPIGRVAQLRGWVQPTISFSPTSFSVTLFLATLFLLFVTAANAASIPERLSFRNVLENDDISIGEGSAVFQDKYGFIWLGGTNSLVRYDGYEFLEIQQDSEARTPPASELTKKSGLQKKQNRKHKAPIKGVLAFYEDNNNILWIGTRRGLLQYNTSTEQVSRPDDDPNQKVKLSDSYIEDVIQLPNGQILACASYGIFLIDPQTLKYVVIEPDKSKTNWLQSERVHKAHIDANGGIWLGTDEGLEKFDLQTKTFTTYKLDPHSPDSIPLNRVADIEADSLGDFWLATANGLVHFDTTTFQSVRYIKDAKDRFSLAGNDVWSVLIDSQGQLWVGSNGGGISVFDKERNRFVRYQNEPSRADSLSSNQIRALFEDNNGDLWIGLFPTGFNFFDRSSAAITSYSRGFEGGLSYNYVRAILEDEKGNLWLGTDGGGLNYFNRVSLEFSYFRNSVENPSSIPGDAVLALTNDSTGQLWIGFWGAGMASFNPQDRKFTRYPFEHAEKIAESVSTSNSLNSEHVWSIREDKNRDLWLATHTGGLNKYNPKTKVFTRYRHVRSDPQSIAADMVWETLEDSHGNFWVGTASGLCLMDLKKGTFTTFARDPKNPKGISSSMVLTVFEDSKRRLWAGTDAGLNQVDPITKEFTVFNKDAGFIDDTIRTILEDAQGYLWLSTNNGFSRFNPETGEIKNYNRIGGKLMGSFGMRSGAISRNGEVMFGGVNGLRIINPLGLYDNSKIPPLVFTGFRIFSDEVTVGDSDGILAKSLNSTEIITLDYSKTNFALAYSALNFRESDKNQYAYKLEGFDNDWIDAGDQRIAKYTNLDPGQYIFRVKGSNNDGIWNEQGRSITIIQLTPPWRTWWAYSLYSLCVLGILFWLIHKQRQSRELMKEQNRILEINVAARTAEVREKSKDMQIMLSNIPEGIFTIQSDGLIHPEYSNYMETIFETTSIGNRELSDFLFSGASFDAQALQVVQSTICSTIGEAESYFESKRSKLPDEYEIEIGDHKKFLSLVWKPIIDYGLVSRIMVSVRDITQIKQMESNLIQSEKLAALGALVAGVSHELNTPIGNGLTVATALCDSCDTMAERMNGGLTKSTLEKFVADMTSGARIVTRNLERASELVSSFKQVAADRTSAQRRKFSLADIINEICLTVSPTFKRTPYSVDIDIGQDVVLDSYPGPLGQVITNLLNNTIIHAFDGRDHGRVIITTRNLIDGVQIAVVDDGVGIPIENQTKIFDPFFTTKLGSGGNGLGMHIVHNIVTGVLGGTISLKSRVGEGTTFTLFIPKVAPAMAASLDDEIPR